MKTYAEIFQSFNALFTCDACSRRGVASFGLFYNGRGFGCSECWAKDQVAYFDHLQKRRAISAALLALVILSWALVVVAVIVGVA